MTTMIDFSSLPIRVAGCWVGAFEGSAEIEIDDTGEAYVDRIALVQDGKGEPDLILKRPPPRQPASESSILFAQLDRALREWNADEFRAAEAEFDRDHDNLGYGHFQHERL